MPAKIAMKTIQKTLTFIGIISLLLCFTISIEAHSVTDHKIQISTITDTFVIDEKIVLQQKDNESIDFFVPTDAIDISLIINNTDIGATKISDNLYQILNITHGFDLIME